jgi:hypothetical protein
MFINKVNAISIVVGNEKDEGLIKRVKLTLEFDEILEGCTFLKVGPSSVDQKCELIIPKPLSSSRWSINSVSHLNSSIAGLLNQF